MYIIKESKQVGIIYHFTTVESLSNILTDGGLKNTTNKYISFTRNFDLLNTSSNFKIGEHIIRFALSGDKLSNKYRIEPYLDKGWAKRQDNENEERVLLPRGQLLKCFDSLLQIEIIKNNRYKQIVDILSNFDLSVQVDFVSAFKPYKY